MLQCYPNFCFPAVNVHLPAFTLQLDEDKNAIKITDSKVRARNIFLEKGQLPKPGGPNPLLDIWNNTYGVEIFYFPSSSLEITNLLR